MTPSYKSLSMKVADVMSKQVDSVRPDDRVEKVALLIFGRSINGIPVLEGKKLVGMVTEQDILKKFFPSISEIIEDTVHEANFESMEEKASTIMSLPVAKVMNSKPTTVKADTPLLKAESLMDINEVGRLPVVDSDKKLVGIISKGDVFRTLIGEKLLFTENEDYNDFLSRTYYSTVDWDDRLKKELPDLLKIFKEHNVKTVLDVGCGTGEHSIELAKRGYSVVGTDRSQEMINEANIRKVGLPSEAFENVHFWHKDAEDLIYELDVTFDAIIIMGNTLSHNPDNYRRLLKAAINCLSKDGVLILQITNFEKVLKTNKRLLNFNFANPSDNNIKEFCFVEFYDYPVKNRTILKTFAILASDGKRWKWSGIRNSLMAYTDEKRIKDILKVDGLSNVKTFGGSFDGKTWDYLFRKKFEPMISDWLNVIATGKK